jgi:peroxiredoxin
MRARIILPIVMALLFSSLSCLAEVNPGQIAPDCSFSPMGPGHVKGLDQLHGKVIYIDFWASWCGPCAQSFPFMNSLQKDLGGQGFQVIGVNLDERPDDAVGFIEKTPANFTLVSDKDGQCAQEYGVKAMPSSYVIDRHGVLRHIHLGFKSGESADFRRQIEALLAEP